MTSMGRRARRAAWTTALGALLLGVFVPSIAIAETPAEGRAAGTASAEDELLATFAPVIAVRAQPVDCEEGEPYLPMSVDDLFEVPGLRMLGPDGAVIEAPTLDDLAEVAPGPDWYIDIPGNALKPGCSYERLYNALDAEPVIYGRVVTDPDHPGQLVVQYWFFYLYNDFNDRHEGDWEMMQIVFDVGTAEEALEASPTKVMFAQHEGGEVSDWASAPLQRRDGTHAVVYSAQGSHASYFSSARWFGKSAQSGFGCDDTRPATDFIDPAVIPLTGDEPWLAFTGHWGEKQPTFNNGPTGPSTKTQWLTPVSWVEDEGRVGAVDLPSEGSFATSAFCAVVRFGSVVFLRFLDSPVRLVLVVVAIVMVVMAILRRTRFKGASIDPVIQRRRAGQHLGAAIQLVRANPRPFVSIGALLPAAGLVAAVLQLFLTNETELGDGLELAGSRSMVGSVAASLLGLLVVVPVTSIVYVAVAAAVRDLGTDSVTPSWRRSMASIREHPRAVGAELVTRALTNALLFTIVLSPVGLWLLARWCVVAAAGLHSTHPMRRSAEVTRSNRLRAGALAALATTLSLSIPALVATLLLLLTGWSFLFVNVITGCVSGLVIPVMAATMALLYGELATSEDREDEPLRTDAMS